MTITMEDLVMTLGLIPRVTRSTEDIYCQECGHKTLHFDFRDQVFACPVCGYGGGVIDAWAHFRGIEGSSKKETRSLAKRDLEKYFGNNPKPKISTSDFKRTSAKPSVSLEESDAFNRKILARMPLSEKHRQNLRDRGLNDEQIDMSGIGSYRRIPSWELQQDFGDEDISKYAGGYMRNDKPYIADYGPGMIIKEMSVSGLLQGFQLRKDEGDIRYLTYSSDRQGGTAGKTYTHFANYKNASVEEVILTEGPLKGTIINFLTGVPTIAIPGVNSQKYLIPELITLKKMGLKKIIIAFDMDYYTNPNVQKALRNLKKRLSDLEIPFIQRKWNPDYKGYDDYLSSRASK